MPTLNYCAGVQSIDTNGSSPAARRIRIEVWYGPVSSAQAKALEPSRAAAQLSGRRDGVYTADTAHCSNPSRCASQPPTGRDRPNGVRPVIYHVEATNTHK